MLYAILGGFGTAVRPKERRKAPGRSLIKLTWIRFVQINWLLILVQDDNSGA
jgi:predicted acetyltransferase